MHAQPSYRRHQAEEVHGVGLDVVEYSGVVEQPRTVQYCCFDALQQRSVLQDVLCSVADASKLSYDPASRPSELLAQK